MANDQRDSAAGVAASRSLAQRAAELNWYHTLELGDGVVTRGYVDNRSAPARLPFPSLEGKRCLDIGTMNGFWAFELERRGAAEVLTLDVDDLRQIDWPPRTRASDPNGSHINPDDRNHALDAFNLAREALRSNVQRVVSTVYDISTEQLGEFDFVFVGSILLHLRDPVAALDRIREVCRGEVLIFEAIDMAGSIISPRTPRASLDGTRAWWWTPNLMALRRMIWASGFDVVGRSGIVFIPAGEGFRKLTVAGVLRSGPNAMLAAVAGFPHVGFRARPVGATR
jgi:tRNA (mo5U34)-methyltransferase